MTTVYSKVEAVKEFLEWLGSVPGRGIDPSAVTDWVAASFIECDTAIGHGGGHQSTSKCANPYPGHTTHYSSDERFEWDDDEVGSQTTEITRYPEQPDGSRPPVTKTYRLAFD